MRQIWGSAWLIRVWVATAAVMLPISNPLPYPLPSRCRTGTWGLLTFNANRLLSPV